MISPDAPDAPDPRRPLRVAARASRLLGIALILIGTMLLIPTVVGGRWVDPRMYLFVAGVSAFCFGPAWVYFIAADHVEPAKPWAAVLGLTMAGAQVMVICCAAVAVIGMRDGALGIMLMGALLFSFQIGSIIRALRAMNLPEISEARGFEPIMPAPKGKAGGVDGQDHE